MIRAHRRRWTHSDEMLALILEQLSALLILTEYVNTDPKKRPSKLPRPFRYKRPLPPPPVRYSTPDEIRRFFA